MLSNFWQTLSHAAHEIKSAIADAFPMPADVPKRYASLTTRSQYVFCPMCFSFLIFGREFH